MIGCIDIEFRPSREAVAKILGIISGHGYTLAGLRLIPCPTAERATLKVNIGHCRATPETEALAVGLMKLEETICVIHGAKRRERVAHAGSSNSIHTGA